MLWKRHKPRESAATHYAREFEIDELTAQVLLNRGFNGLESMSTVLRPSMDGLHDPFLMRNMDKAVRRIRRALVRGERIQIHGDYDVDGVTSISVLLSTLRQLGADVGFHVINRRDATVGLSVLGLERDHLPHSPKLVITADCGTSSNAAIERASQMDIDVIVVDHHLPGAFPPKCAALLNPQQPRCTFPFKELAAVGVAFQLVRALDQFLRSEGGEWPPVNLDELTDLVALGTISDLVPLVEENRIFVHRGLELVRTARRPGICALMRAAHLISVGDSDLRSTVNARTIGFRIAPLLNAAGRMNDANKCVDLLTTDEYRVADAVAAELVASNHERQQRERAVLEEATERATRAYENGAAVLLLADDSWHAGVLGIVASRLVERFNRPSIVTAIDDAGMAKGSVRGPEGIDMLEALRSCRDLLDTYGGHRVAAGVAFDAKNIEELGARLDTHVLSQVPAGNIPDRSLAVDATVVLDQLGSRALAELDQLAPFGAGNPEPLFEARSVHPIQAKAVGGRNVRLRLRQGHRTFAAFGFGLGSRVEELRRPVDVVFHPRLVRQGSTEHVELLLRDFAPSR